MHYFNNALYIYVVCNSQHKELINTYCMKESIIILFTTFLIVSCSKQNNISISEKVEFFEISECQTKCGIDSIGIRKNEIKSGDLFVKLGYIVNCSWQQGYLKNIIKRNDTLIIEIDRPHDIDTLRIDSLNYEITETYPLTDCDCFFYFDLKIKKITQVPKIVRISSAFKKEKYWDEIASHYYDYEVIEETILDEE